MADKFIDLYKLTGLNRDSSADDIKKARKKWNKELHEDILTGQGKAKAEIDAAQNKLKEINAALDVLEDPETREKYDRFGKEWQEGGRTRDQRPQQPGNQRQGAQNQTYDQAWNDLMEELFGKKSGFEGFFNRNETNWARGFGWAGSEQRRQVQPEFIMTNTDLALLNALRDAYKSKVDGKWQVKKAEDDKREWMPEKIFTVEREGNKVIVYRIVSDWRSNYDRDKDIRFKDIKRPWDVDETRTTNPNARINEFYLKQAVDGGLKESYFVPSNFSEYMKAMKSLARKFAEPTGTGYDVNAELMIVNQYNTLWARGVQIEGSFSLDHAKETAYKIPFDKFWAKLKTQESRVVRETTKKAPEGQAKAPEGKKPHIVWGEPTQHKERESQTGVKKADIYLPDTDTGLLSALVQAYKTETKGQRKEWIVKTSEQAFNSNPDGLPANTYKVIKLANGEVKILRSIMEFREKGDKWKEIKLKDGTSFGATQFLGEHYLMGEGLLNLQRPDDIPPGLGSYLISLKVLARGMADNLPVHDLRLRGEIALINKFNDPNTQFGMEGREKIREMTFNDLPNQMRIMERECIIEAKPRPEGQEGNTYQEPKV